MITLFVIANAARQPRVAGLRLGCLVALAMAGTLFAHAAARAQTQPLPRGAEKAPEIIRPLLGAWDLEQAGASRKCTIVLGVEDAPHGRQLRFPATCRRALPVLETAMTWTATPKGLPILNDAQGKALITFEEKGTDAALQGKGTDGNQYLLDPKSYPRAARRPRPSAAEVAATAAQRPTTVDPSRAPAMDSLPGRYAVMRQQNREACRIALNAGPVGRAPAAIESGCQDTGLLIFDPVAWRYEAGRLTLLARKGHSVELVFENGQWRKDPAIGSTLMLRKLAN
ncbi:AprI/Inh family metalloprotease inhibitor [Bosea sp. PAMC 26642]|uniref:AprI/Inh family metalloprotease inhibitor n=1 Tax=Bosea sp. (strain PAMC 26642) TaxID=1792307 RepID=UPI0007702F58|nr:AprI/Inh family metalloprotease inhibitor [Bosea sp. PAMC 26642]AMJ61907.1 hypothetical protein AXW83_17815 [Bosea sp. PAMC 26642]